MGVFGSGKYTHAAETPCVGSMWNYINKENQIGKIFTGQLRQPYKDVVHLQPYRSILQLIIKCFSVFGLKVSCKFAFISIEKQLSAETLSNVN